MSSSDPIPGEHAITKLRQKSLQSIKRILSPCHPRRLPKLLSLITLKTPPSSPPIKPSPTFHLFPQLPSEIKILIWTIYISFPRIHILTPSSDPSASDPWPLILTRPPYLHPSLFISHESRSIYQQTCWLETLSHLHVGIGTQAPISNTPLPSSVLPSFIACSESNMLEWETDIFWFKEIPTVKKLSAGSTHGRMRGYEDIRKVALDYAVLDYEEEGGHWRDRFKRRWYGLVCVLHLFEGLEEVYFVLNVEGDVKKGEGELLFEVVDVEERGEEEVGGGERVLGGGKEGLRFPQLDDRGMYPLTALERLFSSWEVCRGWKKPKIQFVYARNIA